MRRGQFDRQRQAVEPIADLRHGGSVLVGDREGGSHCDGALDEQRHRFVLGESLQWRQLFQVGQRQGWNRIIRFGRQAQHLPAGDQYLQPRRGTEEIGDQRGGVDHLLEIIQHEKHLLFAQVVLELLFELSARGFAHIEGLRDGLQHQRRIAERGERYEKHAVLEVVHHVRGGL